MKAFLHAGPRQAGWCGVLALVGVSMLAQTPKPRADQWLAGPSLYPVVAGASVGSTAGFEGIETDAVAGRLKIYWTAAATEGAGRVTLFASAEMAGHWPARDWHSFPMSHRGGRWEAGVPVESVDIPMVFFLRVGEGAGTRLSAMRICVPRAAGLEEPSRIFWPYLEGFEGTLESWRWFGAVAAAGAVPLQTEAVAKQGKASLRVAVPGAGQPVGVATTRVRGWQIVERSATGLRVWMRTRSGAGRVRFTLFANAGGAQEIVMPYDREVLLDERWQKVDLAFARFGKGPLAEVDLLAMEFAAEGGREFLVDELQLLGPWKLEVE